MALVFYPLHSFLFPRMSLGVSLSGGRYAAFGGVRPSASHGVPRTLRFVSGVVCSTGAVDSRPRFR
jgi:hypothetical protein